MSISLKRVTFFLAIEIHKNIEIYPVDFFNDKNELVLPLKIKLLVLLTFLPF